METELEKIPAQIGTAVLDASDGRIVKVWECELVS